MHWVEHDGVRLPTRVGGHPALDFCNTWAGWGEPPEPGREWLPDYDRLVRWTAYTGLVDDTTAAALRRHAVDDPGRASEVLAASWSLRAQLHAAVLDAGDSTALEAVSAVAREAYRHSTLRAGDTAKVAWQVDGSSGLGRPLLTVALAAVDLLTGDDRGYVKACPGDDCGWLFIDRRGRRRWCSMSACGNRAKVRAHARRQR